MAEPRDEWASSVVLGDGEAAFVRPITPADAPLLLAFHERQPRENLYRRFFSAKPSLSERELEHFTTVDFEDRVALVLEYHGEFIAWASYERWHDRDDAEVAFMVDEGHQGKGIATLLLEHLAAIARANGVQRFTAEVLSDNRAMLRVFSRAGWPVERHYDSGITELEWPLIDTDRFLDSVASREQRADSRAVARLLLPRSVAVIGASDEPGSVGHELWRNLTRSFDGPVFPVNARHAEVGGVRAYATVGDIVEDVWLAIIAVPAAHLVQVIDECIAKRVRGAVVITSVDVAAGAPGIDMAALVAHARRNGMRIIGPTSMGIASPRPGGIQAALVNVTVPHGGVAISLQSGSLGASVLQLAREISLGLSWFVSLGDKADISGNDLLQFWEDDESTRVIAIYTESFGNPRKFARLARRVGRTRPIVAVRTGAAAVGLASDALYAQAGLIEVPTVRAMLDVARVLVTQPVPKGSNVTILTNARSPGVLARAALETAGLTVVDPPATLDWRATDADIERALSAALADPGIDAVMVIHAPPLASAAVPDDAIERAVAGNPDAQKPLVAVMLGRADGPLSPGSSVPAFAFPEPAAAVLGRIAAYSRWLATEAESVIEPLVDVDAAAVNEVIAGVIADGRSELDPNETRLVLDAYRLNAPPSVVTRGATEDELVRIAASLGHPVAVKATKRRVGRSAQAGVALDLFDDDAVRDAVRVIRTSLGDDADELIVQQMVPPGVDVRICCSTDERLGPVVTVGLGSMQVALPGDVSRLVPLSVAAGSALVDSSPVGAALTRARLPREALVETIRRVSQIAFDHHEIDAIDIDPALVSIDGCHLTDVHVRLGDHDRHEPALRRLG